MNHRTTLELAILGSLLLEHPTLLRDLYLEEPTEGEREREILEQYVQKLVESKVVHWESVRERVLSRLTPYDFKRENTRKLFEAIQRDDEAWVTAHGKLVRLCIKTTPTSLHIDWYISELKKEI